MIARVTLEEGYYGSPFEGWIKPVTADYPLVNVMWHPTEGPQAVVVAHGELVYFPIGDVEILDQ